MVLNLWAATITVGQVPNSPANPSDIRTRKTGIDWNGFLGPNRDSKSSETGILTKWPAKGLPIKWQTDVGTGYGSCTTARGRCFFFDRVDNLARLRCLNAETGKIIWTYTYKTNYDDAFGFDNGPRTSPLIDDDRVYVFGVEGQLHCVSVSDGKKIWSLDTNDEFDVVPNFFGVGSTPAIHKNLLVVMMGGSPPEDLGTPVMRLDSVTANGSAIVALNKLTGKVVYSTGDDLASYASIKLTTIGPKTFAIVFARGGLRIFQIDNGKEVFDFPWRAKKLESVNAATPVVADGRALITESYEKGCAQFDLSPLGRGEDPSVTWQDPPRSRDKIMASHWMTPVVHDGFMYGCTDSPRKELRCVDWKTGEVKWRVPSRARSSFLYADGHILSLAEDGNLQLFAADPSAFQLVAETKLDMLGTPAWSAPVLSNGLLYVRGSKKLVCLQLIDN